MKTIKNIIKVQRTYYSNLNGMIRLSNDCVKLPAGITWTDIPSQTPIELTITDKTDDKVLVYTMSLKLMTCADLDMRKHYAYLLKSLDGHSYLIGSDDRPFVTNSSSDTFPANMTDSQLKVYNISYVTNRKLPVITE